MFRIGAFAICVLAATLSACATSSPASLEAEIPKFAASENCAEPAAVACAKYRLGAQPLEIQKGARIYRETWVGPFRAPMHSGSIELTVWPDGTRTLKTPWKFGLHRLRATDLAKFESTLAVSDFASRPVFNALDPMCIDGVATTLEAYVDGKYRIVYFDNCGGVSSEQIAQALDQLFVFAAGLSGLRYPVNPDRPTYRW